MNLPVLKIVSKVVLAEKTVNIKLLGDSITHGLCGTGFKQDGEPIIHGFFRNKNGYCWANLFKEYMQKQFNCTVTNNACTGTDIEFIIENFNQLVDNDDDIVICTIGTNNRSQSKDVLPKKTKHKHMEEFYNNIIRLNSLFKEIEKDVIFVANIPASEELEKDTDTCWRIMHMNDVNDLYMKASVKENFAFISMYTQFLEYCELKNISVDSLLDGGLHPNDKGYEVIYKLMLKELGIGRGVSI